ncbi:MAG: hypothetical protein Q7U05_14650 [Polaromonas sp.]|nr:hypothetical protein [Polaromonas sp.]
MMKMVGIRLSRLQVYAGVSIFLNALFYITVLIKYGVAREADNFLYLMTALSFFSILPQMLWGGFLPHYVNGRGNEKFAIINFIVRVTLIFGVIGIVVLNVIYYIFDVVNVFTTSIFCYLLAVQALNEALKKISIAEQKIENTYLADIVNWVGVLAVIYFGSKNLDPLYSLLVGCVASIIYIIFILYGKIVNYSKAGSGQYPEFIKESFILKLGAFMYLLKDTFIASVLVGGGVGLYATYSYASKAVTMVFLSIVTPYIEREGNIPGVEKKYVDGRRFMLEVLKGVSISYVSIHAAIIFLLVLSLYFNLQLYFNLNYVDVVIFYVILIPLSLVYICEHSLSKYWQVTRNFRILTYTNAICFFSYLCVWLISNVFGFHWIYLLAFMYVVHMTIVFVYISSGSRCIRSDSKGMI